MLKRSNVIGLTSVPKECLASPSILSLVLKINGGRALDMLSLEDEVALMLGASV